MYKLEDMKTYPGRKKIDKMRKLGALHKEADEIVTKLTKDFINSIDYDNQEEGKNENTFHNFTFHLLNNHLCRQFGSQFH